MVKAIKKRQGILGVLKVPGTPKKWETSDFSIFTSSVEKSCFPLIVPKNARLSFFTFWGAGDLQNTKYSLSFLDGFDHGGENDPFY